MTATFLNTTLDTTLPASSASPSCWMAAPHELCEGSVFRDITLEITYLGAGAWALPETWTAHALAYSGAPRLTRWRITDAQGVCHQVYTRA